MGLLADRGATVTGELGAPAGVSPAHNDILALLEAYSEALRLESKLPSVVVRHLSSRRAMRWFPALRLRLFLRRLLVHHVRRAAAALKRECNREAVPPKHREMWERDIALLERFEQSLPSVATRTIVGLFSALVFVATLLVVRAAASGNSNLETFIVKLTRAIVETSRHDVIDAFAGRSAETILLTAWLLVSVAWFAMLMPASSYRLKQAIFALATRTPDALRAHIPSLTEGPPDTSVARLERNAFQRFDREPPRDWPLDLVAQALLVAPVVGWGILIAVNLNDEPVGRVFAAVFAAIGLSATWVLIHTWRARPRLEPVISDEDPHRRTLFTYAIALPTTGAVLLNVLLLTIALLGGAF
ncbi:MAG: hypothetical protein QOC77_49 [Thermoleophilaceae bacterium]|nr:hypothetical protein [Thermoleophilaceae bacterium]